MRVKVLPMGDDEQIVTLEEGASVRDALEQAGLPQSGIQCTVNGRNASLAEVLGDRQTVTVATKSAGG